MKSSLLFALTIAFVCLSSGCRAYKLNRIEDVKLVGNQMYLLVRWETGRDHASRFSHSAAFEPKRRTLIVVSCDVSGNELHPVFQGKLELDGKRFLAATIFRFVSTNTFAVGTSSNLFEVVQIDQRNTLKSIHADRISFNPSRTVLIACGDFPTAYSTETLEEMHIAESADLLHRHCQNLQGTMVQNSVISDDLKEVVIQNFSRSTVQPFEIWEQQGMHSKVVLTNASEILRGISKNGNVTRIFVSENFEKEQSVAFLNPDGQVAQKAGMQSGELVFDGRFDPIISVPVERMFYEEGNEKWVEVWNPGRNEKRRIHIDTKEWLSVLNQ